MKQVLTFILLFSLNAVAANRDNEQNYLSNGFDFAAPTVPSTASVSDKQVGMIIYDLSTGQFKGLNGSGNWDSMTTLNTNPVVSGGTTERIVRALIAGSATSPTVTRQSGTWINSITRNLVGNYTLNIAAGTFSAPPTCTTTCKNAAGTPAGEYVNDTTATSYNTVCAKTDGTGSDTDREIICMGPQ